MFNKPASGLICTTHHFLSNLRMGTINQCFFPNRPFLLSLMLASKSTDYPSEEFFRCSTLAQAPCLTHKFQTSLEKPVGNKHTSLIGPDISYEENRVFLIQPRGIQNAFLHNLLMGVISQCVTLHQAKMACQGPILQLTLSVCKLQRK